MSLTWFITSSFWPIYGEKLKKNITFVHKSRKEKFEMINLFNHFCIYSTRVGIILKYNYMCYNPDVLLYKL